MQIYFAASISGGREKQPFYSSLVKLLSKYGNVLTSHIGKKDVFKDREGLTPSFIYKRDRDWLLNKADVFVAEISVPSLGVGYEIALAELKGLPNICLYHLSSPKPLSWLIEGNSYCNIFKYEREEEALERVKEFMESLRK